MKNKFLRSFLTLCKSFPNQEFSVDDAKRVLPITYVKKMLYDLSKKRFITRVAHSRYKVNPMESIIEEWAYPTMEDRMNDIIQIENVRAPLKAEDTLFFIDTLKEMEFVAVSPMLTAFYSNFNHFSVETVLVVPNEKDKEIIENHVKEFSRPMMLWIDVVDDEHIYENKKEFPIENYVYVAPQLEDAILLYLDYLKRTWLLEPRDVYYMVKSLDKRKLEHVIEKSKKRETYPLLERIMSWDEKSRVILSWDELRTL